MILLIPKVCSLYSQQSRRLITFDIEADEEDDDDEEEDDDDEDDQKENDH